MPETYAAKTAHLKIFSIETGESDEGRYEMLDDVITPEQVQTLFNYLCDDNGRYTPKGTKVCLAFKFSNIADIKTKKYDAILKAAK